MNKQLKYGFWIFVLCGTLCLFFLCLGLLRLHVFTFDDHQLRDKTEHNDIFSGVVHIHTDISEDAYNTIDAVIDSAKKHNLDFIVLTEHNIHHNSEIQATLRSLENPVVFQGVEHSFMQGHLWQIRRNFLPEYMRDACFSIRDFPLPDPEKTDEMITVVAHPLRQRKPWKRDSTFKKTDGFEIFNAGTEQMKIVVWPYVSLMQLIPKVIINPIKVEDFLVPSHDSDSHELSSDLMNEIVQLEEKSQRNSVWYCAADSHGFISSDILFDSVQTKIWNTSTSTDTRNVIFDALKTGRFYCQFGSNVYNTLRFHFWASHDNKQDAKKIAYPGSILSATDDPWFGHVFIDSDNKLDDSAVIEVYRGEKILNVKNFESSNKQKNISFPMNDNGFYTVIVFRKENGEKKLWVISNPIRVSND